MEKKYFLIIIALFLMTTVMGCNTMKGAGKDVEQAGQDLQKAADKENETK